MSQPQKSNSPTESESNLESNNEAATNMASQAPGSGGPEGVGDQSAAAQTPTSSAATICCSRHSTTESQTSGYTTESSYQTSPGYVPLSETNSYASLQSQYPLSPSILSEVHVDIEVPSTEEEIESAHQDLRDLLISELNVVIRNGGVGVYLIAYQYM